MQNDKEKRKREFKVRPYSFQAYLPSKEKNSFALCIVILIFAF